MIQMKISFWYDFLEEFILQVILYIIYLKKKTQNIPVSRCFIWVSLQGNDHISLRTGKETSSISYLWRGYCMLVYRRGMCTNLGFNLQKTLFSKNRLYRPGRQPVNLHCSPWWGWISYIPIVRCKGFWLIAMTPTHTALSFFWATLRKSDSHGSKLSTSHLKS